MKAWLKLFVLITALAMYITLGSLSFLLIEGENGRQRQAEIREILKNFIQNHSHCGVTGEVLGSLLEDINTARPHRAFATNGDPDNPIRVVWTYRGALIFCFSVVTTIGFGWISPRSLGGQIFCVVYAIPGIALNGYVLTVIGRTCQSAWEKSAQGFYKITEYVKSKRARFVLGFLFTVIVLWVFLLMVPAIIYAHTDNWSTILSQYFNFITLSTIGFGDVAPTHAAVPPEQRTVIGETTFGLGVMLFTFVGMAVISVVFTALWRYQKRHTKRALYSTRLILIKHGIISDRVRMRTEETATTRGIENNGADLHSEHICG